VLSQPVRSHLAHARHPLTLACACACALALLSALNPAGAAVARGARPIGDASAAAGGGLSLIIEPDQGLGEIDRDIATAKHSVDVTMYELDDTTIEREFVADARRGVRVRVLLNGGYYGGGFSENDDATSYLRANGVTGGVVSYSRYLQLLVGTAFDAGGLPIRSGSAS